MFEARRGCPGPHQQTVAATEDGIRRTGSELCVSFITNLIIQGVSSYPAAPPFTVLSLFSSEQRQRKKIPYPVSELIFSNAHCFVLFVYFPQREFLCLVLPAQQPGSLTFSVVHVSFPSLKKSYRIPHSISLLRSNSSTATSAV